MDGLASANNSLKGSRDRNAATLGSKCLARM
jgi:hypothetical protein